MCSETFFCAGASYAMERQERRSQMFSLTSFNPWHDLAILHRDLDAFFGGHFASLVPEQNRVVKDTFTPAGEIVKDGDKWMVSLYIPGVDANSIDIEVVGRMLRVSGERSRDK